MGGQSYMVMDEYTEASPASLSGSYVSTNKDSWPYGICVGVRLKIIEDLKEDNRMMKDFEEYLDIVRSLGVHLFKDGGFPAFGSG